MHINVIIINAITFIIIFNAIAPNIIIPSIFIVLFMTFMFCLQI